MTRWGIKTLKADLKPHELSIKSLGNKIIDILFEIRSVKYGMANGE